MLFQVGCVNPVFIVTALQHKKHEFEPSSECYCITKLVTAIHTMANATVDASGLITARMIKCAERINRITDPERLLLSLIQFANSQTVAKIKASISRVSVLAAGYECATKGAPEASLTGIWETIMKTKIAVVKKPFLFDSTLRTTVDESRMLKMMCAAYTSLEQFLDPRYAQHVDT
jgi:hypothetical protein